MGFQLKGKKGFVKRQKPKTGLEEQFDSLLKNIAALKKQEYVDAVYNMHAQFKRTKELSNEQVGYLNFIARKAQNG